MFVLSKSRVVMWPVDVPIAVDGGQVETHRFTAHFELLPEGQVRELVEIDADNKELLRKVLHDIDDVQIEGGSDLSVGAMIERLLDVSAVRIALIRAYFQALHGAPAKNVVTPPPGGPAASTSAAAATGSPRT